MRLAARLLGALGLLALIFGFLAMDFIPHRILITMTPVERALADPSLIEMAWISRGLQSLAAGGILLVASFVTYLLSFRAPPVSPSGQLK